MMSSLILASLAAFPLAAAQPVALDTVRPVSAALAYAQADMRFDLKGKAASVAVAGHTSPSVGAALARVASIPIRSRDSVLKCQKWSDVEPPLFPQCTFVGASGFIRISAHSISTAEAVVSVVLYVPSNSRQGVSVRSVKLLLIEKDGEWRVAEVLSRGAS